MIQSIYLKNFKGFAEHTISFIDKNIIVGKNNSGKSSLVEAFQLLSNLIEYFNTIYYPSFNYPPKINGIKESPRGISISLKDLNYSNEMLFNNYNDPPAVIKFTFKNNIIIKLYILQKRIFIRIYNEIGEPVTTNKRWDDLGFPKFDVLPQLTLLQKEEFADKWSLKYDIIPYNSSAFFRRHLYKHPSIYSSFKDLVEKTFPEINVREINADDTGSGKNKITLLIRESSFVSEVGYMGHGLQMWLQILSFLVSTEKCDTIILDEPDVYMHPDLQHKLVTFLFERNQQIIFTTHSTEILADVEPKEIIILDRNRKKSPFVNSLPGVQQVIDHLGSVHNLQLTRLWSARRCIFVEGKDLKILFRIQKNLFPDITVPLNLIPSMSIGGWGGWNYVIGISSFLKNAAGDEIIIYCIFDSDYHTSDEISSRIKTAKMKGIRIYIWERKEIENYLIIPSAIRRFILLQTKNNKSNPSITDIKKQINNIAEKLKPDIFDALSTEIHSINKREGVSYANKFARNIINKNWDTIEGKLKLVSGKKMFSYLSYWSQKKFGISFSPLSIAQIILPNEVSSEILSLLHSIDDLE